MICTIAGCGKQAVGRGWCKNHYYGWKRNGDPEIRLRLHSGASDAEIINKYVDSSAGLGACWPWTACRDVNGYGHTGVGGKDRLAHRVAWEVAHGPIPEGLDVLHHCDNPPCCNAYRCLFLGTQTDNNADMVAKGRRRGPSGEAHPHTSLSDVQVLALRADRAAGLTLKELAVRYDVCTATASNLSTGKYRQLVHSSK